MHRGVTPAGPRRTIPAPCRAPAVTVIRLQMSSRRHPRIRTDTFMSEAPSTAATDLPESLWRDRSFWGMTATQFLGAFNDNLFKQVVLLLCIDIAVQHGTRDYQPQAQRLFALPFVLFSGFAGYLSDRFS